MANNTLLVSPSISGNIGSCKTEITKVVTERPSFFYEIVQPIATNSCTGEVQRFISWQITDSGFFAIVGTGIFLVILFSAIMHAILDR